jgi:hypothetical protein
MGLFVARLAVETVPGAEALFRLVPLMGVGSVEFIASAPPQPYITNTEPVDKILIAFRRDLFSIG